MKFDSVASDAFTSFCCSVCACAAGAISAADAATTRATPIVRMVLFNMEFS